MRNKKYLVLLTLSGFVVCLDQLVKTYIHTQFSLGESLTVIPNYFNLTYVRNVGAAFGILGDLPPTIRDSFFLIMPPIAIIIILGILKNVDDKDTWQIVALTGVFAGALGNYIDRLRYRYVIDFLDFHIHNKYVWPSFNVADMSIVGGVGLLLILMLLEKKKAE